ncbi:MAG: hypothetical protein Q9222_005782 [Ikaeria aurantiellina]
MRPTQAALQQQGTSTNRQHALRTLKLLEQHHQRLAELLKFRHAHPIPPNAHPVAEQKSPAQPSSGSAPPNREESPYRAQTQTVPLPARDVTSSIASNLASARGIPSNRQRRSQPSPLSPQATKPEPPNPARRSKLIEESYQSQAPRPQKSSLPSSPEPAPSAILPPPAQTSVSDTTAPKSEEPFQKFYATFESLFSKLSAPLAFAGLPLNPDESAKSSTPSSSTAALIKTPPLGERAPPSRRPSSRRTLEVSQRASADPDYSSLFSRAALRAVAEEHGPGSVGANESFYVVPTSGHTLAYADILARQHQERRRVRKPGAGAEHSDNEEDFEADEELFVDARETPGPPSPELQRRATRGQGKGGHSKNNKTMEELQLENEAMKALLDQTSRRLLEFEMSAQTSSVALQRSIRQLSTTSHNAELGGTSGGVAGANDKEAEEKLRALEEQVLARVKEMAKMQRENEKLKGVVGRYRERFESIKAGARARRDERGKGDEG